jgi:hypothetical protein
LAQSFRLLPGLGEILGGAPVLQGRHQGIQGDGSAQALLVIAVWGGATEVTRQLQVVRAAPSSGEGGGSVPCARSGQRAGGWPCKRSRWQRCPLGARSSSSR